MMKIRLLLFGVFLIAQMLSAQNVIKVEDGDTPHYKPQGISGTPILNTPELMTYLESLGKETFAKTLKKSTEDTVGGIHNFYVYNIKDEQFESVEFQLLAKGTLSQVWCSSEEITNGHLTQAVADTFLLYLESKTGPQSVNPDEGIIAIDQEYYGHPPDKDGDGLVDALLCDIKDGWEPGSNKGYTAGFFYSMDQTNIAGKSNKADIIYLDSYPGIYYNDAADPNGALQTIAHEYQHLIHFNYDRSEYTFINEGLSENAEYITGLYTRSADRYLSNVNVPIYRWNRNDALPEYSRTSLFYNYIGDRFGVNNYKFHTQNPLAGPAGFNAALDSSGYAGVTLNEVIHDFHIANLVNDRSVDEKYGYLNPARAWLEIPEQSARKVFIDAGNKGSYNVVQGGAAYLTFDHVDVQESVFTFPANAKVTAIIYHKDGVVDIRTLLSGMKYSFSGNNSETINEIDYVMSNTDPSGNENIDADQVKVSWIINGAKSFHYQTLSTYKPVSKFYWAIPYYNSTHIGRFGFTNKYTIPEEGYLSQMKLFISFGVDGSSNDSIKVKGDGQVRIAIFNDNDGLPGTVMAEDTIAFSVLNPSWNSFDINEWNLFFNQGDVFHAVYEVMVPSVDNEVNSIPLRLDNGGGEQGVCKIITSPGEYATMFADDDTHGEHGIWNEIVYKVSGPESPKDLKAVAGDGSVWLTWTKSLYPDFKMYKIYGGTSKNPVTVMDSVMVADTTYLVVSGLNNGKKHYFRMTIVDNAGKESEWSSEVSAVPMSQAVADIKLGVLQNPVFTENIDIFLSSNDVLDSYSVALSLKQGNSSRSIGLYCKDGKYKVFQNTKTQLQTDGEIILIAKAKQSHSVVFAYDTLSFTTAYLNKKIENIVNAPGQSVKLKIRKNSIPDNFRMLVIPMKDDALIINESVITIDKEKTLIMSDPFLFSPDDRSLNGEIQWEYNGEDEHNMFVAKWEDNRWILIDTYFNDNNNVLYADISKTGKYILVKSLAGKENMSSDIPRQFTHSQNYPNPVNPQTTIKFSLPENQNVRLDIFNMLGQKVHTLVNSELMAGYYYYVWNGKNNIGESVASGIYFYRLQAGESFSQIKKMTLIR